MLTCWQTLDQSNMAWLWCTACIVFHFVVYWLEATMLWWIAENLAGMLITNKEDGYHRLILRQQWRWFLQQLVTFLLFAIKVVLDMKHGRFLR